MAERQWGYRAKAKRWARPNPLECAEACIANVQEAAKEEARLRELYARLPPGDPRFLGFKDSADTVHDALIVQINTQVEAKKHWKRMADWWRKQARADVIPAPAEIPDPRLPREAEGEEVPF